MEKVKESGLGVKIGCDTMPVLLFADDMLLVANNEEELRHLVQEVK